MEIIKRAVEVANIKVSLWVVAVVAIAAIVIF
jgi:hypothetical protein